MKKINLFFAAVSVLFFGGCASDKVVIQRKPQPLPAAHAPVRATTTANANFTVADEVNAKLRVSFYPSPAEKSFCIKLAKRLADSVVLDKADIVLSSGGDVVISLKPEFELIDKTGNYYRVNCNEFTASIFSKQKIYAMTTIEPAPLPRKLGADKAKNQYMKPIADAIVPFLKKELDKISNGQIAVSIVDFSLKNIQENPEPQYVAAQVNRIAQVLSSMSGVINYTNIRQDVSKAACSFRIVYLKEQFPQGITNVLNLKLASK